MSALRVTVRVPATTRVEGDRPRAAPVGLWLTLSAAYGDAPPGGEASVIIERAGTLRWLAVENNDDRVVRGFVGACRAAGRTPPTALHLRVSSQIPLSLGLGASAAATVAGALAANALLRLGLDEPALAAVCTSIDRNGPAVGAVLASDYTVSLRTECEPSIPLALPASQPMSIL